MKSLNFIFICTLLLLPAGCSNQKNEPPVASPLKFAWDPPKQFQVTETIQKKENTFKVLHNCELLKTNDEFELRWLDAKILEANGEKLIDSTETKQMLGQLESSFIYPSFRVSHNGEFIENIDAEEYTKKSNQMLDVVATNRTEENREYFTNFAKSETGRQVLNQFSETIWQTWVEAWTDVILADGESRSANETTEFWGVETPVAEKISNLGPKKPDGSIVCLRYEQAFTVTNYSPAFNDFIKKFAADTRIKSGGPITNEFSIERQIILEVQTERQTLKPHWAKQTTKTIISAPEEKTEAELEIREYDFSWLGTNSVSFKK